MAEGICDPAFAAVGDAFRENLEEELGAAVVVRVAGRTVVDLVGGWADEARTRPWRGDTVVDVFSTGKAFVALTVLSLGLDLDAPAWQDATLRQVLSHQAGHPAIREELPAEATYDWERLVGALEAQEPWWEPGTAHGYHVNTFGFLCGEIVRRASGETTRRALRPARRGGRRRRDRRPGRGGDRGVRLGPGVSGGGGDGPDLDEDARLAAFARLLQPARASTGSGP